MPSILFGFVGGFLTAALIMLSGPSPIYDTAKKVLTECEASLPRNQVCELYAKPEEGKL